MLRRFTLPLLVASIAASSTFGCAAGDGPQDAGMDAATGECAVDSDCADDGIFCNGTLACVAGECVARDIPTCSDGITCTVDTCNPTSDECENMPDTGMCPTDTVCYPGTGCAAAPPCEFDSDCGGDGVYCNGDEVCVDTQCLSPMDGRDCDDENSCTMDECVEASESCTSTEYPDIDTNPMHCGTGANDCVVCPDPPPDSNQVAICTAGACGFDCAPGYIDADGDPANGCEVMCSPMGAGDLPDDAFVDANCDGIDGDRAVAIFVSTTGNDSRDGLTPATSVGSISRAFDIHLANPSRNQILVANGIYPIAAMLEIPNGIGVYGGYSDDFLTRTDTRASIQASSATAFRASGLRAPTVFDRVNVSTADRLGESEATITFIVANSQDRLTLRHLNVLAGRGGDGRDAGSVGRGANGGPGGNASGASGGSRGSAGGGGGSGRGGQGATGRRQASGPIGGPGDPGSCGIGGSGGAGSGAGGLGCADGDPRDGGPGGPGCNGTAGGHGPAGDGIGAIAGEAWMPDVAMNGDRGGVGGGGGGGGAGGGEDCTDPVFGTCIYCGTGRGGGGGGGGGQGGPGGLAGTAGGASIGILLISSTVVAEDLRIQTGGGGNGGRGAAGGNGGNGGPGGAGATSSSSTEGSGGDGGPGGDGGTGGCGGGGGGGPSIAVWGNGTTARIRETTTVAFAPGAGGTGGGSCGNAGGPGLSSNLRSAFLE